MRPDLTLTDAPDAAARDAIGNGLAQYNEEQTGISDVRPIGVLISDPETGQVVGGLIGRTSLGLMFIDLVYIPAAYRGARLGSEMLEMAEAEARRRGCCSAVLVTISFQAPGFYAKHGYTEMGRVPCHPPGTSRVLMWKAL
jgi:ribosomal protein S18 acetylase RimI-like enzyme